MSFTNQTISDWSLLALNHRHLEKDIRETQKMRSLWLHAISKDPLEISSVYLLVSQLWDFTKPIDLHPVDANIFIIVFHGQSNREKVLAYNIKLFFDTWFVVREWPNNESFSPPDFTTLPIWLHVNFIPSHLQNELSANLLTWFSEAILEKGEGFTDPISGKKVMCIKLLQSIYEPFPLGFRIKLNYTSGVGALFKYDDLSSICQLCGIAALCNCKSSPVVYLIGDPQVFGTDMHRSTCHFDLDWGFNKQIVCSALRPSLNHYMEIDKLESKILEEGFYYTNCIFMEDSPNQWVGYGQNQLPLSMKDKLIFYNNQPSMEGVLADLKRYFMLPRLGVRAISELAKKVWPAKEKLKWKLQNRNVNQLGVSISTLGSDHLVIIPWNLESKKVETNEFAFIWATDQLESDPTMSVNK